MIPKRWAHLPAAHAFVHAQRACERARTELARLEHHTREVATRTPVIAAASFRAHVDCISQARTRFYHATVAEQRAAEALLLSCVHACISARTRTVICHGRHTQMTPADPPLSVDLEQILNGADLLLHVEYLHADVRGVRYRFS